MVIPFIQNILSDKYHLHFSRVIAPRSRLLRKKEVLYIKKPVPYDLKKDL